MPTSGKKSLKTSLKTGFAQISILLPKKSQLPCFFFCFFLGGGAAAPLAPLPSPGPYTYMYVTLHVLQEMALVKQVKGSEYKQYFDVTLSVK